MGKGTKVGKTVSSGNVEKGKVSWEQIFFDLEPEGQGIFKSRNCQVSYFWHKKTMNKEKVLNT